MSDYLFITARGRGRRRSDAAGTELLGQFRIAVGSQQGRKVFTLQTIPTWAQRLKLVFNMPQGTLS